MFPFDVTDFQAGRINKVDTDSRTHPASFQKQHQGKNYLLL
ncbi:hypothetical protein EZS27_003836 [termite gut metagenome]|uniref:Uncharacterized protein n=1 Tax=termite gut metagenome TaxID=433724 RepID=A0A5J4SS95_9ZZZZ